MIGVIRDIRGLSDREEQEGWIIGIMLMMIVDAIGITITCKLFPTISLCGC